MTGPTLVRSAVATGIGPSMIGHGHPRIRPLCTAVPGRRVQRRPQRPSGAAGAAVRPGHIVRESGVPLHAVRPGLCRRSQRRPGRRLSGHRVGGRTARTLPGLPAPSRRSRLQLPDRLRRHRRGRQRAGRPRRRLRAALHRRLRARAPDPAPLRHPAGADRLGGQSVCRRADVRGSRGCVRRGGPGGRQALHRGLRPWRDPARIRPRRRTGPGVAVRAAQPAPGTPHRRGRAAARRRAMRGVRHRRHRPGRPSIASRDAAQAAAGPAAGNLLRSRPPACRPGAGPRHYHLGASRTGLRPCRVDRRRRCDRPGRATRRLRHPRAGGVRRAPGRQALFRRPGLPAARAGSRPRRGGRGGATGEDPRRGTRLVAAGRRAPPPARRGRRVPAPEGQPPHRQRQLVRGQLRRVRQRRQPICLHSRRVRG